MALSRHGSFGKLKGQVSNKIAKRVPEIKETDRPEEFRESLLQLGCEVVLEKAKTAHPGTKLAHPHHAITRNGLAKINHETNSHIVVKLDFSRAVSVRSFRRDGLPLTKGISFGTEFAPLDNKAPIASRNRRKGSSHGTSPRDDHFGLRGGR